MQLVTRISVFGDQIFSPRCSRLGPFLDSVHRLFAWAAIAHSADMDARTVGTERAVQARHMAQTKIEKKALDLLNAFERAGKSVGRVTIEGRRIELVLNRPKETDEYEGIDMRHGKT